jgi:hypothetical protein
MNPIECKSKPIGIEKVVHGNQISQDGSFLGTPHSDIIGRTVLSGEHILSGFINITV